MKILAIRGANIASLEGSFEVDFEKPPLVSAGLFAITGPTGAGKSTLLDVLCLGLFGETPRSKGGGNLEVPVTGDGDEGQRITAKDSRNLLRRGAVQGFAETDFRGVDGVKYRARWEVRRARLRPAGALQLVRRTLFRVDAAPPVPIADGEKDVTAAVTKLLGLSFDQFRKAVLLAQGDFAAFLRASDQERADLLEKITGADIYTRVSKKAWEKGQGLARALGEIEARIASLVPMDDGERRTRDEDAVRLRLAVDALEERRRRLYAARGMARETADRESEALGAAGRVTVKREVRDAKGRDAEQAEEQVRSARDRATAAHAQREGKQGELDAAKALDARIDEKADETRRAETDAGTARGERAEAAEAVGRLEEEHERARAVEADSSAWLSERAATAPLDSQWERCGRELEQLSDRLREIGREESKLAETILGETAAAARVAKAALKQTESDAAFAKAETAVGVAEGALVGIDRAALGIDGARISDEIGTLAELERICSAMGQERQRLETARRSGETERRLASESDETADAAAARAREEEERVALLQKARDAAAARRDLEDRRRTLEAGQPCPLCGSAEHPWAEPDAVPADRTVALEGELAAKRALLADTTKEETRRRAEAANARRRAEEAGEAVAKADVELVALGSEWTEKAVGLPQGDSLREAPGDEAGLDEVRRLLPIRRLEARSRQEGVRARAAEAVARDAEAGRARKARDESARLLDAARKEILAAEKELSESQGAKSLARTRVDALERGRGDLVRELERFAAEDPESLRLLQADPEGLRTRWAADVDAYRAKEEERDAAVAQVRRLELERSGAASRLETTGRSAAERERRAAEAASAVAGLRMERASLLGGRRVAEVIEELDRDVAAADEALRVAAERKATAEAERAGAEAAVGAAVAEETRAREIATGARIACDGALVGLGLRPGPAALEELDAETASTIGRWKLADEERQQLVASLRGDDVTRSARRAAEEEKRKAEEGGKVWRQLSDLIGSASGNEFRKFAQGLTLRTLVTSANRHLEDLARRYRLVPARGSELGLLVVDGDMGDEVRSVESLSGGESFLVSLALALGLASLSTRSTSIGSLFIDEGFGSLDLETLKKAMAALDALQSKGRRVGVISHVHGLADEIGVQVRVVARGGGRSEVRVVGA
ncbi:MAG: AAA family ATPase [Holophagales bacterium]|nr:AAA family ATPase [Holophagales bacterium]